MACSLAAGVGLALPASPLAGQEIRGLVLDSQTSEPVSLAYVGLLEPGRQLVAAALAGADGAFVLRAPAAGSYFLTVERLGYQSVLDGLFELPEGGVVEVQIGLRATAIPLDALIVEVEGMSRDLRVNGYYERKALGRGRFLEGEDLFAAVANITDAFRAVPRLVVRDPTPSVLNPTGVLHPEVLVRRGAGMCSPTLYVDGNAVLLGSITPRGPAVRPDDFVHPSEVEAVEIYTGIAETPPEFEATGGCGALVIWTRVR